MTRKVSQQGTLSFGCPLNKRKVCLETPRKPTETLCLVNLYVQFKSSSFMVQGSTLQQKQFKGWGQFTSRGYSQAIGENCFPGDPSLCCWLKQSPKSSAVPRAASAGLLPPPRWDSDHSIVLAQGLSPHTGHREERGESSILNQFYHFPTAMTLPSYIPSTFLVKCVTSLVIVCFSWVYVSPPDNLRSDWTAHSANEYVWSKRECLQ